jgi:hypothetical protein
MTFGVPTSLSPGARAALQAPSAVTRAVAAADRDPERRWMLRLPRPVRRSFVAEMLDIGAGRLLQERWMLLQADDVRESYVEQVLLQLAEPDTQLVWLLRQDRHGSRVLCRRGHRRRRSARRELTDPLRIMPADSSFRVDAVVSAGLVTLAPRSATCSGSPDGAA